MKRDEIKAHRAAKIVADVQPTPINPGFISITELLARLQAAPAEPPTTMTDAAEWLLFNWCNAKNPPAWKCNGKFGIVPIDAFTEKHEIPLKRLNYVYHRGQYEWDSADSGASTDYELYGFDRKEFTDFLSLQGEPLDLFFPMPEPQADTAPAQTATPAPVVTVGASDTVEPDAPWWMLEYDIFDMAKNIGEKLHSLHKTASNAAIAKEIEIRINGEERRKGRERVAPNHDTIRGRFTGMSFKPD